MINRRTFLKHMAGAVPVAAALPLPAHAGNASHIMTVNGPLSPDALGTTLIHEHLLVDFSGYASYDPSRWNHDEVVRRMLPFLAELRDAGCQSLVDCTPNFLGRDPLLLQRLSRLSGVHIVTNTGYYGGSDHKYLPPQAFSETAQQLAARWIAEATDGLDATGIRPGFIKISVNRGKLTDVSRKLITAAALTHRRTGLAIASHTGPAVAAFEQIDVLRSQGVAPDAFVWVHAQEADPTDHARAARLGAWVSLDGLSAEYVDEYADMLSAQKKAGLLHRTLVSHDAGWYEPGKPDGGNVRGYTTLFTALIPALQKKGFAADDIRQLLVVNPAALFSLKS